MSSAAAANTRWRVLELKRQIMYVVMVWKRTQLASSCDGLEFVGLRFSHRNCCQNTPCHLPGSLSGVDEACALFWRKCARFSLEFSVIRFAGGKNT